LDDAAIVELCILGKYSGSGKIESGFVDFAILNRQDCVVTIIHRHASLSNHEKAIFVSTFALLASCLAPLAATADQVTFHADMPLTLVPDQFALDLPKFDTSLGVLEGVEICLTASGSIDADIDNIEPTGGTAQGEVNGLVEIDSPAMQGFGFVLAGSNTFPGDSMGTISDNFFRCNDRSTLHDFNKPCTKRIAKCGSSFFSASSDFFGSSVFRICPGSQSVASLQLAGPIGRSGGTAVYQWLHELSDE